MADFSNRVFVFGGHTFKVALEDWTAEQLAVYPHRAELIRVTALAMRDCMSSPQVTRHKITMAGAVGSRCEQRLRKGP